MASTATIHTTTQAGQLRYPGTRRVDRQPATGHLFYVAVTNTGGYQVYRSTNKGVSWAAFGAARTAEAAIVEMGGFFVDWQNRLYLTYRTNVSGQDRIWMQAGVITASNVSWHSPLRLAAAANDGTPGSYFSGMAPLVVRYPDGRSVGFVAVGHQGGTSMAVRVYGFAIPAVGQPVASNTVRNKVLWFFDEPAGGHQVPAVGYELSPAHAWVAWGRTYLWTVKLTWNGSGWTGPNTAVRLTPQGTDIPAPPAVDSVAGVWRNPGWLVAQPYQYDTTQVIVWERNQGNTRTASFITPAHPAGVVKHCTLSYNNVTRDFRVYAVGTSNPDLHYIDYSVAGAAWSGWSTVSTTDVAGIDNYSVRRESFGSARYDVLYQNGAASPWTVTHVSQDLTYAPFTPAWRFGEGGNNLDANGRAWDTTRDLDLRWTFDDPDTADTQSAWAISRQIGTGALAYLRASDSTWQAAEVKNVGATPARTLPGFFWGLTSDPNHSYRVKVWDSTDAASVYSAALVVVPSGKVNPTVTSPTPSQVITQDSVTVTWTAAEQTAWRVRLKILAETVYDSGWRAGTDTSHTPDLALGDGFNYGAVVETRNAEGLGSDEQQVIFSVDFVEPATATVTLTPLPQQGIIRAAITNPAPVGAQPAVARQELYRRAILNPYIVDHDFETADMSGWAAPYAGAAVRTNTRAHKGSWSYQLTSDGTDALGSHVQTVLIPCTANVTYYLDMWATASVLKNTFAQIRWYDGGGTFVAVSDGIGKPPPAANAWDYRWAVGTAPGNATHMRLCAVLDSVPAAGDVMWVDEVRVRVNDPSQGVRIASGLPSGAVFDDWQAASGVAYEYRVQVRGVNNATVGGVWTA
ncbi:hypothetical protein [Micromonospora aurantiaca (nom. illeg.)]|uniref:hypothetical protein n=1 Tax=Micromonospora aurantiaca (nom. illeg.) TaxID=47850 RepID=UPI003EBC090E